MTLARQTRPLRDHNKLAIAGQQLGEGKGRQAAVPLMEICRLRSCRLKQSPSVIGMTVGELAIVRPRPLWCVKTILLNQVSIDRQKRVI